MHGRSFSTSSQRSTLTCQAGSCGDCPTRGNAESESSGPWAAGRVHPPRRGLMTSPAEDRGQNGDGESHLASSPTSTSSMNRARHSLGSCVIKLGRERARARDFGRWVLGGLTELVGGPSCRSSRPGQPLPPATRPLGGVLRARDRRGVVELSGGGDSRPKHCRIAVRSRSIEQLHAGIIQNKALTFNVNLRNL